MIGRLLGGLASIISAICVATVIAAALGLGYLRQQGKLDEKTLLKVVAVINGMEASPAAVPQDETGAQPGSEQASLEHVARQRALKSRDIELREQALNDNLSVVRAEYAKLIDEKDRYERIKAAFRAQLDQEREGVLATNREVVRGILENLKPKQAKEQILRMVNNGEMTDVIKILSLMPSGRRGKILGEFKTDEEAEKLADILKQIRDGVPEEGLIDEAENALAQPDASAGSEGKSTP
ncbi:MAG TPA: hypothetical protein VG826_12470 [Pirellulales bacterium]|nr:hypothetical protein [Pirellulales bacterium]